MSNYILFDDYTHHQLLPLTFTRPVCDIRIGITTIREKWSHFLKQPTSTLCVHYLQRELYPLHLEQNNIFINGSIIPNEFLVQQIKNLQEWQCILDQNTVVALRIPTKHPPFLHKTDGTVELILDDANYQYLTPKHTFHKVNHLWDIFQLNASILTTDYATLTQQRTSVPLSSTNQTIGVHQIFVEEGARVEGAFLNASKGPIYVGKDAEIMEGSLVRGPVALGEHAVLKMGAKIYGATTLGPYVKVGGEVNNSVIFGYSNKGHDGFLGNSVIGEWCNLGADTNNSNLKNNYGEIKVWNYEQEQYTPTGLQFCGLMMGDHSKSGINTMFNTGTVVGVAANVFGSQFPPKFIPSFSWGGADGFVEHQLPKVIQTAERMYGRRHRTFSPADAHLLAAVLERTAKFR